MMEAVFLGVDAPPDAADHAIAVVQKEHQIGERAELLQAAVDRLVDDCAPGRAHARERDLRPRGEAADTKLAILDRTLASAAVARPPPAPTTPPRHLPCDAAGCVPRARRRPTCRR